MFLNKQKIKIANECNSGIKIVYDTSDSSHRYNSTLVAWFKNFELLC